MARGVTRGVGRNGREAAGLVHSWGGFQCEVCQDGHTATTVYCSTLLGSLSVPLDII